MSRFILKQYIQQVITETSTRVIDAGRMHLEEKEYTSWDKEEFDYVTQELLRRGYGTDIEEGEPRMKITKPFDGRSGKFKTSAPSWEVQGLLVNYGLQKRPVPTDTLSQGHFSRAARGSICGLLVSAMMATSCTREDA